MVSYLDVGITVRDGHFDNNIFDNRDNISISIIVNFPFMSSHIAAGIRSLHVPISENWVDMMIGYLQNVTRL